MRAREVHGMTGTKVYNVWRAMVSRCHSRHSQSFRSYGARGILVAPEWRTSFKRFYADMGDPPEGCFLDRIDGRNGYSKSNCRWATRQQNCMNAVKQKIAQSKFKGVRRSRKRWQARITHDHRLMNLGNFISELDAARAYDAAAKRLFGVYASLNFSE